jgi:D-sedoheptulose 7-phosphate isomerase
MEKRKYIEDCMQEMIQSAEQIDIQQINDAVQILFDAYKSEKHVFSVGNGGSASTASHFAADLGKFATGDHVGFKSMDIVSNYSAHTAWTNDTNWENTWVGMLNPWIEAGDVLVLFSVHGGCGWSNNLSKAIRFAQERGAKTIGLAGAGGGDFKEYCDVFIDIPTSCEELVTPVAESLQVLVHHTICATLREMINEDK